MFVILKSKYYVSTKQKNPNPLCNGSAKDPEINCLTD